MIDPWFLIRNLFHLQHPRSPLSSETLVYNAFFGPAFPRNKVREFAKQMPNYESLAWPVGMLKRFADIPSILRNIQGWETSSSSSSPRIMVMAGGEDKLTSAKLMRDMGSEYRRGIEQLSGQKRIHCVDLLQSSSQFSENVKQDNETGLTMVVVEGAGHHVQNDVQADEAAEALRAFLQQL